jgi:hypothetical protein
MTQVCPEGQAVGQELSSSLAQLPLWNMSKDKYVRPATALSSWASGFHFEACALKVLLCRVAHEAYIALLVYRNKPSADGDDVFHVINIIIVQSFIARLDS